MNERVMGGIARSLDLPEAELPTVTNTPRPGDTPEQIAARARRLETRPAPLPRPLPGLADQESVAAKHRELLDAIADLPLRLEIATDDAARKLGAVQQRERVKAAVLALLSDAD